MSIGGQRGSVGADIGRRDSSNISNVVGMSSGVGISDRLAKSNLGKSVGISLGLSLSLSFPLVETMSISSVSKGGVGRDGGSIAGVGSGEGGRVGSMGDGGRIGRMGIGGQRGSIGADIRSRDSSNISNVVGMSSGVGISDRLAKSNLGKSVGISLGLSLSLSFPLVETVSISSVSKGRVGGDGCSIARVGSNRG